MGPQQTYVFSDTLGLFYFKESSEARLLALTEKATHLIQLLNRWLLQHKPDLPLPYTTITLNTDYSGCPHRDPNE
eukprot:6360063-Prorocentrum_lima.AAC.1